MYRGLKMETLAFSREACSGKRGLLDSVSGSGTGVSRLSREEMTKGHTQLEVGGSASHKPILAGPYSRMEIILLSPSQQQP